MAATGQIWWPPAGRTFSWPRTPLGMVHHRPPIRMPRSPRRVAGGHAAVRVRETAERDARSDRTSPDTATTPDWQVAVLMTQGAHGSTVNPLPERTDLARVVRVRNICRTTV